MYGLPASRVAHLRPDCVRSKVRAAPRLTERAAALRRPCRYCARGVLPSACLICADDAASAGELTPTPCGSHALCAACLEQHMLQLASVGAWDGIVRCPCKNGPAFAALPPIARALCYEREARRSEARSPVTAGDDLSRILDAAQARCPHCDLVFLDFDGCAAVQCQCGEWFCGLCLSACDGSVHAHRHVLRCRWNLGDSCFVPADALRVVGGIRVAVCALRELARIGVERGSVVYALGLAHLLCRTGLLDVPHTLSVPLLFLFDSVMVWAERTWCMLLLNALLFLWCF